MTMLLLQSEANPNGQDNWGDTTLHCAAMGKQFEILSLLIVHSADPNAKTLTGQTPLSLVKRHANRNIREFLVQN